MVHYFFVDDLQAVEADDILGAHDDGVLVDLDCAADKYGFPRVRVTAPTREAVVEYCREVFGDDDDEWFANYVVARVIEVTDEGARI